MGVHMVKDILNSIRYPIGQFVPLERPSEEDRIAFIHQILHIVPALRALVTPLSQCQLWTPYRKNGWTVQQIIHHMADNDMNAYFRFKRALTEETPTASSYREDLWGEMDDYKDIPVELSLSLLESLHQRFITLLQKLTPEQWQKTLRTEALGLIDLDTALQRFVWHNRHHTMQIQTGIDRNRGK